MNPESETQGGVGAARFRGGCLCGQVRWEASGEPDYMGVCCCADCRRVSGSGFVGFMGFPAERIRFQGETRRFAARSFRGTEAIRNSCPACNSLVYGGVVGQDVNHTLYAGGLDDPGLFRPRMAIFGRDKPDWVVLPDGVQVFETMPG